MTCTCVCNMSILEVCLLTVMLTTTILLTVNYHHVFLQCYFLFFSSEMFLNLLGMRVQRRYNYGLFSLTVFFLIHYDLKKQLFWKCINSCCLVLNWLPKVLLTCRVVHVKCLCVLVNFSVANLISTCQLMFEQQSMILLKETQ